MTEEPELRWHDLATEPPPLGRTIIMFPVVIDVGHRFDLRRFYTTSNPEYARLHGLENGYTHWFPIPPHPGEAALEAKIEATYAPEAIAAQNFHKGFQRASENIVGALKQLVPDRPEVARVIEARYCDKKS